MKFAKFIGIFIIILITIGVSTSAYAKEFSDVAASDPCYDAVDKLSDLGIISGRGDGIFDPKTQVTRAEFCAFLSRANGYNSDYIVKKVPFPDVSSGYWARGVISFSYESGFINGMEDGTFQPAEKVTAAQAIKMVVCAMGKGGTELAKVGPQWYSGYIEAAKRAGYLSGLSLKPEQNISRAQVAQLIYNSLDESRVAISKPVSNNTAVPEKPQKPKDPQETENPTEPEKPQIEYTPRPGKPFIFIDAGHNNSGIDTGAHTDKLKEQDVTVAIALKLKPILERCGFDVMMSRDSKTANVEGSTVAEVLERRANLANEAGAHYFVSIHCNSGGGKGVETYCYPNSVSGNQMAEAVQEALLDEMSELRNRGVKEADFSVLRNTAMPAVLVETGFIDDAEGDALLLGSDEGQQRYAQGIAKGICAYAKIKYLN